MHNIWVITVKCTNSSFGLVEGMSVEIPMPIGETPLHGPGRQKAVRVFMAQYGIDIDVKESWAPIFPGPRFKIERTIVH